MSAGPWNKNAPRRRRWPFVLGAGVLLIVGLLIASAVYAAKHDGDGPSATAARDALAVPDHFVWHRVSWFALNGTQVPLSADHGPRTKSGVLASGFTHDAQGALLAAVNIAARSSGLAGGEEMFRPTIAQQTTGDVVSYLAATEETYREAAERGAGSPALVIGYRLVASTTDDVQFDVVGRLANPTDARRKALITGTLHVRWMGGDWKLVVPTGAGKQVPAVPPGFTPMPGQQLVLVG